MIFFLYKFYIRIYYIYISLFSLNIGKNKGIEQRNKIKKFQNCIGNRQQQYRTQI
jgi:hypothetical protein